MSDATWDIGRKGLDWQGPEGLAKLGRLPGRLEMAYGKLCFDEAERRTLLAALLENVGLDEVVGLGDLELWRQAIAARAEAERTPATENGTPASHWNCRVIRFQQPDPQDTWLEIHEVHYDHGRPVAFSVPPATVAWAEEEGIDAALTRLDRLREALRKPVLQDTDFGDKGDPKECRSGKSRP